MRSVPKCAHRVAAQHTTAQETVYAAPQAVQTACVVQQRSQFALKINGAVHQDMDIQKSVVANAALQTALAA